jgi:hypothetical protein
MRPFLKNRFLDFFTFAIIFLYGIVFIKTGFNSISSSKFFFKLNLLDFGGGDIKNLVKNRKF